MGKSKSQPGDRGVIKGQEGMEEGLMVIVTMATRSYHHHHHRCRHRYYHHHWHQHQQGMGIKGGLMTICANTLFHFSSFITHYRRDC